jgi:hypothetical protein
VKAESTTLAEAGTSSLNSSSKTAAEHGKHNFLVHHICAVTTPVIASFNKPLVPHAVLHSQRAVCCHCLPCVTCSAVGLLRALGLQAAALLTSPPLLASAAPGGCGCSLSAPSSHLRRSQAKLQWHVSGSSMSETSSCAAHQKPGTVVNATCDIVRTLHHMQAGHGALHGCSAGVTLQHCHLPFAWCTQFELSCTATCSLLCSLLLFHCCSTLTLEHVCYLQVLVCVQRQRQPSLNVKQAPAGPTAESRETT